MEEYDLENLEFTPKGISKHYIQQFKELKYDLDEAVATEVVEDIFEQFGIAELADGSWDLDETLSPQGRGILMSLIGFNLPWITSVKPSFIGTLTNLTQDKISLKFQLINAKGVVTRVAGEITELGGDISSTKLLSKRFALLKRNKREEHVAGTTSYTFDLKAVATDANNYAMKRGVNNVTINGFKLDDYASDMSSKLSKRYRTGTNTDGTEFDVEVEFNYADGQIIVNVLDGDIEAGAMIAFSAGLDTSKLDEIVGAISVSVFPTGFVASDICLDVNGNLFDVREMGAMGIPAKQIASLLSSAKIDNELTYALMEELFSNGRLVAGVTDVKNATESTIADRYSNVLKAILNAHSKITIESGEEGTPCVIGGGAVYDILNSLATPNSGGNTKSKPPKGKNRGIRLLDTIDKNIEFYYMPEFDEMYPIDANGDTMICVTNAPRENIKKPVLTGVGLPLAPDTPDINSLDGSKTARLSGSVVIETNPTERLNRQVLFLKLKL